MTKVSFFQNPFLLGFDQVEEMMIRLTKQAGESAYPPYNIEQTEDSLKIILAVAGFSVNDLEINLQDNQLSIKGKQEDKDKIYLHRGIAARQFQRNFILATGLEIVGAYLEKGLLEIELKRRQPDLRKQNVPIHKIGD